MRKKRILGVFFLMMVFYPLFAQKYNVAGRYNNQSAQGMAIWKDYAVLMNNTGICRVLNLKSGGMMRELLLESHNLAPHGNCLSFGRKKLCKQSVLPLLYVSSCKEGDFRCYVEDVRKDSSYLVQTIEARSTGKQLRVLNWIVDPKGKFIYAVVRNDRYRDEYDDFLNSVIKYRLPELNEGKEIILFEEDQISSFDIYFSNLLQDGVIKGSLMYLLGGDYEKSTIPEKIRERVLIIVNLKEKKIQKKVKLNHITKKEPEGLDFYGKHLFMFCGQDGGLYELNY